MRSSNRLIAAMLIVAALAAGFWVLILSPKRQEASELGTEVEQLQSSLALAQSQVAEAEAARHEFPEDYRKLVVLGKAVPANEETSSLLVGLNRVATDSDISFDSIRLSDGSSSEIPPAPVAPEAGPSTPVATTIPATEAAAALAPLGSTIGPAGLSVMPYDLNFKGTFFEMANFIQGIDSMVATGDSGTTVDGRLVTLDGFALAEDSSRGFPFLNAEFKVTTYLVPSGQSVTAGATETAPAPVAEEASTGTPSSFSTGDPAQ
jgi:Tfp pilus assembly protein PilO